MHQHYYTEPSYSPHLAYHHHHLRCRTASRYLCHFQGTEPLSSSQELLRFVIIRFSRITKERPIRRTHDREALVGLERYLNNRPSTGSAEDTSIIHTFHRLTRQPTRVCSYCVPSSRPVSSCWSNHTSTHRRHINGGREIRSQHRSISTIRSKHEMRSPTRIRPLHIDDQRNEIPKTPRQSSDLIEIT